LFYFAGDYETLFCGDFTDTSTEKLHENFIVSSDSVWGEGYSWGALEASPAKNSALFYGDLNTSIPQDGRTRAAGYVSLKSVTQNMSFGRLKTLDFEFYSAIELTIRGDGRSYWLNIHLDEYYDLTWFDLYQFPLYTRGGPYWQKVTIPFSKFLLSYRGFIQDKQDPFDTEEVSNISIVLMDGISGPFSLEIGHIGIVKLQRPVADEEIFAYEKYLLPYAHYAGSHI
jgi:NADH dehydrogenase [ubiquinone] 1 alpha subcomplex assembly factor 1